MTNLNADIGTAAEADGLCDVGKGPPTGPGTQLTATPLSSSEVGSAGVKPGTPRTTTPPSESAKSRTSEILGGIASVLKKTFAVACAAIPAIVGVALFLYFIPLYIGALFLERWYPSEDVRATAEFEKALKWGPDVYQEVNSWFESTALSQTEQSTTNPTSSDENY